MQNLQEMLHQRMQGKRYFIVVYDIWEYAHSEYLENAFSNEGNNMYIYVYKISISMLLVYPIIYVRLFVIEVVSFVTRTDNASRLLLTSRYRVIAKYATYVHEMKLLDPEQGWELLLKKAFIEQM